MLWNELLVQEEEEEEEEEEHIDLTHLRTYVWVPGFHMHVARVGL
jgi:CRISPR/Cas system-associated protein Csx1